MNVDQGHKETGFGERKDQGHQQGVFELYAKGWTKMIVIKS